MPLIPNHVYMDASTDDWTVGGFGTEPEGLFTGKKLGSAMWNQNYHWTGNSDTWISLGKVATIDINAEFPSDTIVFHTDRATAALYPLAVFDNGCEFCASVYADTVTWQREDQTNVTKMCVFVEGVIRHGTDIYYGTGTGGSEPLRFNGLYQIGSFTAGQFLPLTMAKMFGIKFFILTDWATGEEETIPNASLAVGFNVQCCVPYTSLANEAGFQNFGNVFDNNNLFLYREGGFDQSWISNPQFLFYGYEVPYGAGYGPVLSISNLRNFWTELGNIAPSEEQPWTDGPLSDDDPSQEYNPSGPGGGQGSMDPSSDPVDFPALPSGGALASGAIKAFEVSQSIMTSVFQKLWSTSIFDIATFQKLTDAPLDNLISLQAVPMNPTSSGMANIKLGNFDTEQAAPPITQEYYTIDCGTITVKEFWGSALDYEPYTKIEIFLPMIGIKDLHTDDVIGKTLHLKYNYSIFDGNLTAQLKVGNSVLYKWPGNVKETIPVTARVNDAMQRLASGVADVVGGAVRGGGAGAAASAISAAVNVAFSKTTTTRSGDMGGSTGLLDDFNAYLIIHRPVQSLAENFRGFKGYPSNITAKLNSLQGYTEVEYVHLTGISGATDAELEMIEKQLKSGVII